MRRTLGISLAIGALTGCCAASAAPALERCRLEAPGRPAAFAECASLSVPLDPEQPAGTRIELFVARMPSLSASPRPDPLLLIGGGPGQSTIDFYLQLRGAFEQVRRERDLILVDQRGTGRSAAGFTCTVDGDALAIETAAPERLGQVAEHCLAGLVHDPRLYTTSVAVRDLEQVREAFRIDRWNLYGISYGTRVAQHYLRRHPDRARALILDGVVPADVALGPEIAPHAQRSLDSIFARCAESSACAERFGDLASRFAVLLRQLEASGERVRIADPRRGNAVTVDFGIAELQAVVRMMSYSAPTAALLPLLIAEGVDGNLAPLAAQTRLLIQPLQDSIGFAMHNAVVCTEDVPFIVDHAAGGSDDNPYLGATVLDAMTAICAAWPDGRIDADFKQPLQSEHPVMMLSGADDPITPPAYALRAIAGGLRNYVHLNGSGQGHGLAATGCVPQLMRGFLEQADPGSVDATCLAREPVPDIFLNFNGPLR